MRTSFLNDSNPNWSNRPPKETILLDGCDFEHWLVVVEKPEGDPTRDDIIESYINTLAKVVGSYDEARMKIYSVSTRCYYAFGALVSEEVSYKLKELPGVRWVLPDSYLDVKNKDYGGEPFIDGNAVPYDPKYHAEWINNNAKAKIRNDKKHKHHDRPRPLNGPRPNNNGPPLPNEMRGMRPQNMGGEMHNTGPNHQQGQHGPKNGVGPYQYGPGPNGCPKNGGGPYQSGPGPNGYPNNESGPYQSGPYQNGPNNGGGPYQPGPGPNNPNNGGGPYQPGPVPNSPNNEGGPYHSGLGPNNGGRPYQSGPVPSSPNNGGGPYQSGSGPNGTNNGGGPYQSGLGPNAYPNNGGRPYQFGPGPNGYPNNGGGPYQYGPGPKDYPPNASGENAYQIKDVPGRDLPLAGNKL